MSLAASVAGLSVASAAAPVDCNAYLVGSWHGERTITGESSVTLTITYSADGSFSAQRTELKGETSASIDQPSGTWIGRAAESPRMCRIDLTNARSGETTTEWIDVAGPDQYRTGHGDGDLTMERQKPEPEEKPEPKP